MALNGLILCADVPLSNYSLTHSLTHSLSTDESTAETPIPTISFKRLNSLLISQVSMIWSMRSGKVTEGME